MGTAAVETTVIEALTELLKRGKRVLNMIKEAVSCDSASSHHRSETHMWLYDPIPDLPSTYAEHEIRPCIKESGEILSVFLLLFFQTLTTLS